MKATKIFHIEMVRNEQDQFGRKMGELYTWGLKGLVSISTKASKECLDRPSVVERGKSKRLGEPTLGFAEATNVPCFGRAMLDLDHRSKEEKVLCCCGLWTLTLSFEFQSC